MNIQQVRREFESYAKDVLRLDAHALRQNTEMLDEFVKVAYEDAHVDAQWLGWVARAEWEADRESA